MGKIVRLPIQSAKLKLTGISVQLRLVVRLFQEILFRPPFLKMLPVTRAWPRLKRKVNFLQLRGLGPFREVCVLSKLKLNHLDRYVDNVSCIHFSDGGHQGQPQNVLVRQPIFDGQAIALQQGNDGPVVVPVVQQTSTVGPVPMQERGVQENVATNDMSSRQSSVEDPDLSESSNRLLPGEMKPDMVVTGKTNLATKSLGALKNRKEQIKGHLEDMIGRDEMERLTLHSKELAATGKSAGALAVAIGVSSPQTVQSSSTWSIWTSKSVISLTPSTSSMSQSRASPITSPNPTTATHTTESEHYYTASLEDEMIPFEDTPQVSRFGPISRRGQSIMRPSKPQQSFAPIGKYFLEMSLEMPILKPRF